MVFVSCEDYKTAYFSCSVTPGVQRDLWNVENRVYLVMTETVRCHAWCVCTEHSGGGLMKRRSVPAVLWALEAREELSLQHTLAFCWLLNMNLLKKNDCSFTYLLTKQQQWLYTELCKDETC